jgi:hypothetical protein
MMEIARIKKRRGARPGVQEEGMESESECCSGCFAGHSGVDGSSQSNGDARGAGNVRKYFGIA